MAHLREGHFSWTLSRDRESHREYRVKHWVVPDPSDGPYVALSTPGIPQPGDVWRFGDDEDEWAKCTWEATVTPMVDKENVLFEVEQVFSTKVDVCRIVEAIGDPLVIPDRVTISFIRFMEEATHDRFGQLIRTSSFEPIRGPQVEFDIVRPVIRIEQNVPLLQLPLLASMANTVNDREIWGFGPRRVKFTPVSATKHCHPLEGNDYYTRTLDFEIKHDTFDRLIPDRGFLVLSGEWDPTTKRWHEIPIDGAPPDERNPSHFVEFADLKGNLGPTLLNGSGLPAEATNEDGMNHGPAAHILVEKHDESDFRLLFTANMVPDL